MIGAQLGASLAGNLSSEASPTLDLIVIGFDEPDLRSISRQLPGPARYAAYGLDECSTSANAHCSLHRI